ncbi:hypothetical protein ACFL6O_02915 [candidate division KSB1 bacterium]
MPQSNSENSPNDVLAEQIVDGLVTAGLIDDDHKEELSLKLKTTGVTQEDWNLWIDLATTEEKEEEAGNE